MLRCRISLAAEALILPLPDMLLDQRLLPYGTPSDTVVKILAIPFARSKEAKLYASCCAIVLETVPDTEFFPAAHMQCEPKCPDLVIGCDLP